MLAATVLHSLRWSSPQPSSSAPVIVVLHPLRRSLVVAVLHPLCWLPPSSTRCAGHRCSPLSFPTARYRLPSRIWWPAAKEGAGRRQLKTVAKD
uniref:Uncharacterized protein n=1 Tax=Oryza barthii TaxID=65489 RepID=A0A0D3F7R1_9ORYZ